MPTVFFPRSIVSDVNPGGANEYYTSGRRGNTVVSVVTNTTLLGSNIPLTETAGGTNIVWLSGPLAAAVTISGQIVATIRGVIGTAVNTGAGILIERMNAAGTTVLGTIANAALSGTAWTTTEGARTAAFTPTSTNMGAGERIRVTFSLRNVGLMGLSSVTNTFGANTDSIPGDTYVAFAETFVCADPVEITENVGAGYYGMT